MNEGPITIETDDRNDAGFTLVELLVALALFSLLAIALFENVGLGLRAWQRSNTYAARFEHEIIAKNLLRQVIRDAYPLYLAGENGRPRIDFEGSSDSLVFLGNAPNVTGGGGRYRFNVSVDKHRDQNNLILTALPELAASQRDVKPGKTVLLMDVDSVNFSYFGTDATGQTQKWQETWSQRSEIPELVRLRVTFRSGDSRAWPDLVVAPRIYADVNCVYDAITKRCRGR